MRDPSRWLLTAAAALATVGAGLLALAAFTPWHVDAPGYFAALEAIRADLARTQDFEVASRRFFDLADEHRTAKWVYADLGYSAVAWAGALAVAALLGAGRLTRLTAHWAALLATTGVALLLLTLGLMADPFYRLARRQVPEWSDSFMIPVASSLTAMMVLAPVIALFVLSPLPFRRGAEGSLVPVTGLGQPVPLLLTLVYAVPLLFAAMLIITAADPGGWLLSLAGFLLLWLFLNARGLWLARRGGASR